MLNSIDYSGGGANVVANPEGTATDELSTIQIGNTIYDISGGSSGSSKELLWEYSNTYDITLAHDFTDYDFLIFEGQVYQGSECRGGQIISSTELESIRGVSNEKYTLVGALNKYANYLVVSKTSLTYYDGDSRVTRVWGIKLNGGSSSSDYTDITGILTAGQTSITLSNPAITTLSDFDFYTDKFGVNPTNVELTGGEVVLQPLVTQESELLGTATASSYLTFDGGYLPWKAFALPSLQIGWCADNESNDQWIAYEFPTNVVVNKITWSCGDPNRQSIVSKIQYSSDGISWNDCVLSTNESCNVVISSSNQATHWRMYFNGPFETYTQPMVSNLQLITLNQLLVILTFEPQQTDLGVKVRVW